MTGNDLTTELRRRAERTAQDVMEAARADAERILGEADARVEARRSEARASTEKIYREKSRSRIAAARHESMHSVLVARAGLLERVLNLARTLIPDASRTQSYRGSLVNDVVQALEFIGHDHALIQCSEELIPEIREALSANSNAQVETLRDDRHGFIAMGRGGRIQVDGTLESRLERLAPVLAIELRARIEEAQS